MAVSSKTKASDKQGISKKLIGILKKRYKSPVPKNERPVLETVLYAICLEDTTDEQAVAAYGRLLATFHDLNEVRVSSISELSTVFAGMPHPEYRALQIRGVLHYVFEKNFGFEFESLKKKTLELAVKQLGKIRDLSPFVRAFTLQEALGSHMLPLDESMKNAVIWLGLADAGADAEHASQSLRPVIRKPETPLFCHLVRSFATDPLVRDELNPAKNPPPEGGHDPGTAPVRLQELLDRAEANARAAARGGSKKAAPKGKTGRGTDGKARTNGGAPKTSAGKKTSGKTARK